MELEVLLSTMEQDDYKILSKMNIRSNVVVINQCNNDNIDIFKDGNNNVKWIDKKDRGLSKSRNLAIDNATGDICIIADDDLVYVDNYREIILKQFEQYPDIDIITFQVEGIEKKFKNYHNESRELNFLTLMKVSSVEVAFRLNSIKDKGIKFNELFGAGSKYFAGEENIFLTECLKNGLKIRYVPVKIADLHIGDSSWFKGFNKEYFIAKGAIFTAMSQILSIPYIFQFAIRKHKLYAKDMNMKNAIIYMLKGRKEFKISLKQ